MAPLTLHMPLGNLVQRQEELHDGQQLHLQPEAEGGVHHEVVGGRLEDGEAGCKAGGRGVPPGWQGLRGWRGCPPPPDWVLQGQDSPVTWGRFTSSSFSSTLPSDLKASTCRGNRADSRAEQGLGDPGVLGREKGGTHVLPVVGQQHHRLQAGLLVRGAAGGQLAQQGIGVVVVTLWGTGGGGSDRRGA